VAAIDALLNLVVSQDAESLLLVEGQVPELFRAGERRPLSMPALGGEMICRFVEEVRAAGDGKRYVLEGKGHRTAFDVLLDKAGQMELRRAEAPSVGAPSPRPAAGTQSGTDEGRGDLSLIEALVRDAVAREASDLFLSTATDARMRIGVELEEITGTRVPSEAILALAPLGPSHREHLERHGSVDLALELGGARVRANVFRHNAGLAVAIRPIRRIRSLAELGLPADLAGLSELRDGLVLMVGPSSSGKSSTLAALIDHLNRTRARHVLTIEDPIEMEHESLQCLIHQREVGRDVESFATGLRAALRENPDVILVGEMRDRETFAAALTAAETGHLVFSTLHSGSAAMAIDRIIDSFPAHQQGEVRGQLSNVLRAVITQLLLPGTRPGELVAAVERMMVTHAVAHTIREGRTQQIATLIQTGRLEGMISLEASLAEHVQRGRITLATASSAARSPELLREILQG
jgi:twitching motility protein PilT